MRNSILILEDDIMLSVMFEEVLTHLGLKNLHIATTIEEALIEINSKNFKFAFLDIHIGRSTSYEVATKLDSLKIPFCFLTGDEKGSTLRRFPQASILHKPHSIDDLKKLLEESHLI